MHDGDIRQTNVAVTGYYKSFLVSKCDTFQMNRRWDCGIAVIAP